MNIRKTVIIKEVIETDGHGKACDPITRVVAMAVVQNPFAGPAGEFVEDLSPLFDISGALGERLMDSAVAEFGGAPINLGSIKTPTFILSTREDHIAPWKSTYMGAALMSGSVKFVLGGSGHIAGVVNPEDSGKYGYWTRSGKLAETADQWFESAKKK